MASCTDILCGFWPFSSKNQTVKYREVSAFKKDDDLAALTEATALQALGKLCEKRDLQPSDYQKIAEKYVEVYRLHKDRLEEADDSLKASIPNSKGFVKQFNITVVKEMDKVLSPQQKEWLCTRVSARIH